MKKALIIGINNYPSAPLTGCINDSSSIATVLETNGDGSPNFSIQLKNDLSTKAELKGLIKRLFTGECDTALFYFSGHGVLNETGGYLVTPDYQIDDEGVSMDEILIYANESKIKNRIIILDCCNSGAFGSPKTTGGNSAHIVEGVTILTASKSGESSVEINGHGVFTNLLLDALQGGASDLTGNITPGSIYAHIDRALGPWDQRPVFKTNISRFTSIRTVNPQINIEVLRKLIQYFPIAQQEYSLDPSYEYTNTMEIDHQIVQPYAKKENVEIFKNLQKLHSVGLVVPVNEEHLYFAAMNSKSCKLTALGYHYWQLVKDKRI